MRKQVKILLKNVKKGQYFYLLNKSGGFRYNNPNMTFIMERNTTGKMVEYSRIERERFYSESTMFDKYAVLLDDTY